LGFGLGAFFVSFLPLSLLPMEPNITRMAWQCEMPPGRTRRKTMIHKHPEGTFTEPELKIIRDQILAKYWELANLSPEETKGSITGQLNALEALLVELRSASTKESAKPLPQKQIYRSAWMDGKSRVN
jgi:hypothetical protein